MTTTTPTPFAVHPTTGRSAVMMDDGFVYIVPAHSDRKKPGKPLASLVTSDILNTQRTQHHPPRPMTTTTISTQGLTDRDTRTLSELHRLDKPLVRDAWHQRLHESLALFHPEARLYVDSIEPGVYGSGINVDVTVTAPGQPQRETRAPMAELGWYVRDLCR